MPGLRKRLPWRQGFAFISIAAIIVFLDQISKEWIRTHIAVGDALPEIYRLSIVHVQNTGSAFGMFANQTFLLSLIAIAGLAVILMFFRYLAELGFAGGVALSTVFGGALGNLLDRLRLGYVTDFIYIRLWGDVYWPAFNIADSAITIGAITLGVIALVRFKKDDATKSRSRDKDIRS